MDSCCHRRFFSFPITRDGFKPPRGTNKLKDGSLLLKYGRMVDDATRQAYVPDRDSNLDTTPSRETGQSPLRLA